MHHLQGITALDDVDARQRPPRSANRVKAAAATGPQLRNF